MVRPTIASLLVLMVVVAAGCQDRAITVPGALAVPEGMAHARTLLPGQFEEPCGTAVTIALLSAAGEQLGEVTVWNGPTTAYARLRAAPGWQLVEVRVHGARRPDQFPRTGGAVDPARFRFGGLVSPPAAEVVIEAMHLDNPYGVVAGDEVVLAAFARLQPVDGGPEVEAWAEGTPFQAGEPATHFVYTLQACPAIDPGTVTAGGSHSCGLTRSGTAYCWGDNAFGQLGDGTNWTRLTAAAVAGGFTFAKLSAGADHTCGLADDERVYCWGWNEWGQLGDGTTIDRWSPTPVAGNLLFADVSAGQFGHGCAVAVDGQAFCWGQNGSGQLGDGTTTPRLEPGLVLGGLSYASVSAGAAHTCGHADGRAYCWGSNGYGELGDGTTTNRHTPNPVVGGDAFTTVSSGGFSTCGIDHDRRAYCWGYNAHGQLGDGTTQNRHVPTAVLSERGFSWLAGGLVHTCGIDVGGTAHCWGSNPHGQLGDGTTTSRSTPAPVAGDLRFRRISAGVFEHSCGLTVDHLAYCWGRGTWGALGDGTTLDRHVPTPVLGWADLTGGRPRAR